MRIPNKIKIGDSEYNVNEKMILFKEKTLSGQITYGNLNLAIRGDMIPKAKEDTFFHEIAHGVLKELEFNHPKISHFRNDDKFVQEMGLVLRKTFLDLIEKKTHKK